MSDTESLMVELKPCPFCGGTAERLTLSEDEFGNAGGDVIQCSNCLASSRVEFGRKENLVSAWNTRASITAPDAALLAEARGRLHDLICLPKDADLEIARQWAKEAYDLLP